MFIVSPTLLVGSLKQEAHKVYTVSPQLYSQDTTTV